SPLRLLLTALFAVLAMTTWLVVRHHLWERPTDAGARERAILYNTVTLITLVLGVVCLFGGLFISSLVAQALILDAGVLRREVGHPVGWTSYLRLAAMVSSMATVGGAIGSSLESEEAVRSAAYGYRQRQRRA